MPGLLVACYAILLSAVLLGMNTGVPFLPRWASPAELGLGSNRAGIERLTDRFINRILGPEAASSKTYIDRPGSNGREVFRAPDDERGEEVDHAFTNNDQANAYHVTRLPFTGRTSTADADREPGEPACATQLGGTVWYGYVATGNEALLADTFGTGYQTSLAAYRPSSTGPVPLENACDFDPRGNSQIKVDVQRGTTYLFQIGAAARGGALTFNLKRFGGTILASVSPLNEPGNAQSLASSVSFDGRFVAFHSQATNLVPGMVARTCYGEGAPLGAPCFNVFLRDQHAGTTSLVSVGLDGKAGNAQSTSPQVSDDGRYVAFDSTASDLTAGDTNAAHDVFIRDMWTARTERVSVNSRGEQASRNITDPEQLRSVRQGGGSTFPSMSADGRYVAFESDAPDLVDGDSNGGWDVFVRDRQNGTTRLASLDNDGRQSPLFVAGDSISRDGRWVMFFALGPMTELDGDLSLDLFTRDLWTGTTELVSVPAAGREREGTRDTSFTGFVSQRSISDDGRFVVFGHEGALVEGDSNGVVDVFVRDRVRQTTERVSVSSSGEEGIGATSAALNSDWAISADGRKVVFASSLNLLEPSDQNNGSDIFIHDRAHGVTLRVSASGDVAGGYAPRISGDGMYAAFHGSYPLSRRDKNTSLDIYVFSSLAIGETSDPDVGCAIGEPACFPTPGECASGQFNGYHDGGRPGRGSVCASAAGTTLAYVGGNALTQCGTIIIANQRVTSGSDPNDCPGGGSNAAVVAPIDAAQWHDTTLEP